MKRAYLLGLVGIAMALAGCDDMLDMTPRDRFVNDPSFWNNENQVENYSNSMYGIFTGYSDSNTTSGMGDFYFADLSDDQADPDFQNWVATAVPGSSGYWADPFAEVRRANYMIGGMEGSTLAEARKNHYLAVARLSRAWNYFLLVKRYGDVPYYDHPVLDSDPAGGDAQMPRTDRDIVMDRVLADLDYAIENIGAGSKVAWSKDLVLAMKSDICLYEGTYCKYRTAADNGKAADNARAQKFLNECADASQQIMSGGYSLTATYGEIYNSLDLSSCSEVIFYRNYHKDMLGHSMVDYTSGSTAQSGITKDAFDAFLFADGKPLATTALDKSDAPELIDGKYNISRALRLRDKRLGVVVDSILAFKGHGNARPLLVEMTASTGYTVGKYYTGKMGDWNATSQLYYCNSIGTGYTDAPIYWLGRVYLNYAEARAELGTATQADLDKSINKLQARAGLPAMTLTPDADPANNMGVSSLLWEVRRARRCELMTDGFRYWDLVRWHQLDKLDSNLHPDINLGANLSAVAGCEVTLSGGYAVAASATRTFDKKYYFYPVPAEQIQSNKNTTQNPGW